MRLIERVTRLGTEGAFEVGARVRALEAQGKTIVRLQIGEPDFPTPKHIVEAARKAMDEGWTKYGPPTGLPDLRDAIAAYVSKTRQIKVKPDNVCVVPGSKPIIQFILTALVGPGDEVIYPDPGFPIYESLIRFQGATPIPMPFHGGNNFALDLDDFRSKLSDKTKLVILNSPANPTGTILSAEDLGRIADLLRELDVMVLSDEIYSRIVYDGEASSIAGLEGMQGKTCILDGFSKTYSMTGWRLGYGVMPVWLCAAVGRLIINSNSCTASFTQKAGVAALTGPQDDVDDMVAEFRKRRDAIVAGLNSIPGFHCPVPAGAFYVFPAVGETGIPSKELADLLLNEAGVACLDGRAFGLNGEGHLRFSYANSMENILEGVERIRKISDHWAK